MALQADRIRWRGTKPISIGSTSYTNGQSVLPAIQSNGKRKQQLIVDHDNSNVLEYLGRSKRLDVGSPLLINKVETQSADEVLKLTHYNTSGIKFYEQIGPMVPSTEYSFNLKELMDGTEAQARTFLDLRCPSSYPDLDLDAYGTTAISRVAPTSPVVDAASSLAELWSEGLKPYIDRDNLSQVFRNPADAYLFSQFAVSPLKSDEDALWEAYQSSRSILAQLKRDSGKWIRRRYEFDEVRSASKNVVENTYPVFADGRAPNINVAQRGTLQEISITTTNLWFSGAFTYHLPHIGWKRDLWLKDRLYGVRPGVDTGWNLVPGSWLVDYVVNVGDVMSNINAFGADGLVMPYGYVMCKQETVKHTSWLGQLKLDGNWTTKLITGTLRYTTMQRQPATPYGFGLSPGDLNGRQKSILAALGISLVT
jgi:hypothetical protein